jgi:hypothetical protein
MTKVDDLMAAARPARPARPVSVARPDSVAEGMTVSQQRQQCSSGVAAVAAVDIAWSQMNLLTIYHK